MSYDMHSAARFTCLMLLIVTTMLTSCQRDSGPNSNSTAAGMPAAEPSFAVQAAAVRAGTSDTIRLDERLVTDRDLSELDGLEDSLRRINLSHAELSDAALARLASCKRLVQLRIGSPAITDDGLTSLADLPELKHLHLIGAPLTSRAVPHLKQLTGLSSLYLDNTRLTSGDMRELIDALPNAHLHFDGGHHRDDARADVHER